ncbi:MAG TPA: AtpZ/AtpI family protein [Acidimicrobiales bacterium]|nr:AtpZ/AtpI family protein [Acidimicrobiales bacterium]
MSIAFELVATPAIFGLIGVALDRAFDTTPLFTIGLTLVAVCTVIGLTIWRYGAEMERTDAERRAALAAKPPSTPRWERARERRAAEAAELAAAEARLERLERERGRRMEAQRQ